MKRILVGSVGLLWLLAGCGQDVAPEVAPTFTQDPATVFINEIHYDNEGADAGEAVEIAGPANTDLTGWSVVLYNGANGTVYDTDSLSGTVPDQANGYGTFSLSYPSNGLQNGSPDALALVDAAGTVVQFLSYEGEFAAVGGPADGLSSTDIGVVEASSTPAGFSLQLQGSGATYQDFIWAAPADDSFGAVNAGQTFSGSGGGGDSGTPKLVINELDYDQPGTDAAEFLEIKNVGNAAVNLNAYEVQLVNGGNNSVYKTVSLPDTALAANDYFVICANPGATPNCDLDVAPDTNLIQNGAPDAVAIVLGDELVDTLSYEGAVPGYTEGSGAPADTDGENLGISRFPDGSDTDDNSADFSLRCITPGGANTDASSSCPVPTTGGGDGGDDGNTGGETPATCGSAATLISAVQGSGEITPLTGQNVSVEGVVTSLQAGLSGIYVEEEVTDQDTDPATSEGVFVFLSNSYDAQTTGLEVGDTVRVSGTAGEYTTSGSSQTQITGNPTLAECDQPTAPLEPADVTFPLASPDALEAFEGMLVRFAQPLSIGEYFDYDRFGELTLEYTQDLSILQGQNRFYTPTAVVEPGPAVTALTDAYALRRVTLDDGLSTQNPEITRHPNGQPFSLTNRFRGGDTVQNVVGTVDDTFGLYRVQPTAPADYTATNPRMTTPAAVGGSLNVASFNVLNYFTTLTSEDPNARGADTPEEFRRQQAKIVAALKAINADIFGLIEIENNGDTAVQNLVDALNAAVGAETYSYISTGTIGTDAIKVAIIYKSAAVSPVGDYAILDSSKDPRFIDTRNRPALIQTFDQTATGGRFTLAVNHLKSKGSSCGAGDDDPQQGNCNVTRTEAARALVDYLATDPTGSGDDDFLIVGDLNSYDKEDPIDVLTGAGYTDLNERFGGEFAYSYVFDGQLGYLDYGLSSPSLTNQVTGTTDFHINADEPDLLDYDTTFKSDGQDAIYAPNPYRASDHDPVVVGLELTTPDPASLLEQLIRDVQVLGLKRGDERKLLAQLETAQRHLGRGRVRQADGALERFERQVEKLAGKKGTLSTEQRDALIAQAEAIRNQL